MDILSARQAFADTPDIQIASASPTWISLRMAVNLKLRDKVVRFFRELMEASLSVELSEQLAIALDELLTNAIEHGGRNGKRRLGVAVSYLRTSRSVIFHLRDAGRGFSLNTVSHAAVNNPPGNPLRHAEYRTRLGLRPGGFGILLVKQIADELIYNEFGNEAVFIKYL